MGDKTYTLNERKIVQQYTPILMEITKTNNPERKLRLIEKISDQTGYSIDDVKIIVTKYANFNRPVQEISQKFTPQCPTCHSANVHKISGLSKAGSVAVWGIFSQKVKKQFHCNNCGYEW